MVVEVQVKQVVTQSVVILINHHHVLNKSKYNNIFINKKNNKIPIQTFAQTIGSGILLLVRTLRNAAVRVLRVSGNESHCINRSLTILAMGIGLFSVVIILLIFCLYKYANYNKYADGMLSKILKFNFIIEFSKM